MLLQRLAPRNQGAILSATFRQAKAPALAGQGLFFVAHNVSNVINYAFLLVMSQALAPAEFALFAALFGAIYLASALANTVQTSMAATVAVDANGGTAAVRAAMRRVTLLALPIAAVTIVVARPAAAFLHSDDLTSVFITGASVWLFLLAAVGYGGLQGSGRFALLGSGLIVAAVGRLVLGLAFLWIGFGVAGALLGVAVGLSLSAALAFAPFAKSAPRAEAVSFQPPTAVLAAFLASVAIAIPTSADVVLAQHYFTGDQAGAYAAVSVLGKVVIFGPLAISLIFFPILVRRHADGQPVLPLLGLALLATGGVALLLAAAIAALGATAPDVLLRGYTASPEFLFAYLAAMLVYSLVVTLLYFNLARRHFGFIGAVILGLVIEMSIVALWHPDALRVALVLLFGNLALFGAGLALIAGQRSRSENVSSPVV